MRKLSFCVIFITLFAVCKKHQTPALGSIREVTVASDRWGSVEPVVREILQRRVPTPQPEPEFKLRVFTLDRFKTYSLFRTVFVIGTAQDAPIREILGDKLDSLPGGDYGMFKIPNAWAGGQELVVFVGRGENLLVPGLRAYADRIRNTFQEIVLNHTARAIYHRGRNSRAEDSLSDRYSFTLDIPKSWYLKQEHADSGFIYLFGHYPDRGIFVYWENAERHLIPNSLPALRDGLTRMYYDGDFIEDSLVRADTIEFLAGPALRLHGIWQNEKETIGGPFVSYSFNHEGRFFMIDGLVYNPGKKKLDQVFQIEAIIRTFTPQ